MLPSELLSLSVYVPCFCLPGCQAAVPQDDLLLVRPSSCACGHWAFTFRPAGLSVQIAILVFHSWFYSARVAHQLQLLHNVVVFYYLVSLKSGWTANLEGVFWFWPHTPVHVLHWGLDSKSNFIYLFIFCPVVTLSSFTAVPPIFIHMNSSSVCHLLLNKKYCTPCL